MIRILVLILALNAFIAPASAQTACGMDMSSGSMQMMPSFDADDETASTNEEMPCCSDECMKDCTYHFTPFSISTGSLTIQKVAVSRSFVLSSVPLSELILPITTPPPLV